jgi:GMP synthase (glutamine-hydrolysing)
MTLKPITILRAGDPAPPVAERHGTFEQWIARALEPAGRFSFTIVDVRTSEELPDPASSAAFIMTGSSSSVTERAPWMLRAEAHIRAIAAAGTPFFGICFGHQLAAQALGGEVVKNPRGREIGTVRVRRLAKDPILDGLPDSFDANATHVDTVARLPPGARVLAESDLEPTQAFALGDTLRCVQFHPEIDGPTMRAYALARAELIAAEGGDPAAVHAGATDAPFAESILRNFVRRVVR